MSQTILDPSTVDNLTALDTMFTQLYNLRELMSTPSYTASTPKLTIDSAFNFGWRTTPSAWGAAYCAHEFANGCSVNAFAGALASFAFGSNNYYDGTNYKYKITAAAANYQQQSGVHYWYVAPSGTAGNTITFIQAMSLDNSGNLAPGTDNTQKLGAPSFRWSTVYAGTGTINTSDAREKTTVSALTADELAAAKALSGEIGTYKWLSSIQAKGADARAHVGLTVQRAIEIMQAHNLDPMAYGFICHDQWPDQHDANGNVLMAAGDRYAFRPDELLLFIARGFDARLAAAGV